MRGSDDFWRAWIEQVELPAWKACNSCARSDIFARIMLASPEERFLLASTYFMEVMTIVKWEAAMEENDRVDMELFGFLSFHDDSTLSLDERQVQLLRAIERWGEISTHPLNPFAVWQAYFKTVAQLALLKDCSTETEVVEGSDEKSNHGQKRADVIVPDG